MILEQEMSRQWWNQEMLSRQCVTDLWYWNSLVYLIQCVTHFLNQIYDTGTGNIYVLPLSQSDLWYWNSSVYLIQCVTHFLNQIYDTGTGNVISNVLLTFSTRSMILEQFSVSHPMCYSLSQPDLWYWNRKCYLDNVLLTFSIRSMILEQEMLSRQCMKRSRPTATNTMRRPLTPRMTWCWMMATFGTCDPTSSSTSLTSSTSTPVDVSTREALRWSSTLRLYPLPAPLIGHSCLPLYPLPEELSSTSYRSLLFTIVSFTRRIVQQISYRSLLFTIVSFTRRIVQHL